MTLSVVIILCSHVFHVTGEVSVGHNNGVLKPTFLNQVPFIVAL